MGTALSDAVGIPSGSAAISSNCEKCHRAVRERVAVTGEPYRHCICLCASPFSEGQTWIRGQWQLPNNNLLPWRGLGSLPSPWPGGCPHKQCWGRFVDVCAHQAGRSVCSRSLGHNHCCASVLPWWGSVRREPREAALIWIALFLPCLPLRPSFHHVLNCGTSDNRALLPGKPPEAAGGLQGRWAAGDGWRAGRMDGRRDGRRGRGWEGAADLSTRLRGTEFDGLRHMEFFCCSCA